MKKRIFSLLLCSALVLSSSTAYATESPKIDTTVSAYFDTATITVDLKKLDATSGKIDVEYDANQYELISTEMDFENNASDTIITDVNEDLVGDASFAFASTGEVDKGTLVVTLKKIDGIGIKEISVDIKETIYDENGNETVLPVETVTKTKTPCKVILHKFMIEDGKPIPAGTVYLTNVLVLEKGEYFQKSILEEVTKVPGEEVVRGAFFTASQWKLLGKVGFDINLDGYGFKSINPTRRCDGYTDLFCIIERTEEGTQNQ